MTFTASSRHAYAYCWGGVRDSRFFELHRRQGMYSRTKVRRNAVNLPGFSSGSDSYNRKRSLDIAAGNRSEKGNSFNMYGSSHSDKESSDGKDPGLTSGQVEAFREVFNLFDINGGGTIDADELDAALKTVDIHLSPQEIHDVLHVIDEDGNGEIDFEEFLTLMTSTEKFLENLRGTNKNEGGGSILFSALAKFMRKSALSSMSEIERYYNSKVRKSPHVVAHYAAGARLIGLTEKQMAKRLATLSVSGGENNNSPYAQPVWTDFTSSNPKKVLGPHKGKGKIRLMIVSKRKAEDKGEDSEENSGGNPPGELNESDVETSNADDTDSHSADRPCQSCSPKPPLRLRSALQLVPLPAVSSRKMQSSSSRVLTIEDLPRIRKEVEAEFEQYRKRQEDVRKEVSQSFPFTDVSLIPSRQLRLQFKKILEAYSFMPINAPEEREDLLKLEALARSHVSF